MQQTAERLPLVVVKGGGPSLFEKNRLGRIEQDWASIKAIRKQPTTTLDKLLKRYSNVFLDELGHIRNFTAKLLVCDDAMPKFCKARYVPCVMKAAI